MKVCWTLALPAALAACSSSGSAQSSADLQALVPDSAIIIDLRMDVDAVVPPDLATGEHACPGWTVTPAVLDFGAVYRTPALRELRVSNTGAQRDGHAAISFAGADSNYFALPADSRGERTLEPGDLQVVNVGFVPPAPSHGSYAAEARIPILSSGCIIVVPLVVLFLG